MPRFALDLHVHTRMSPDGLARPERVVAAARSAGLQGIAITDHDRRAGYDRLVRLGLADPSGRAVDGFLVIPGVEVSCVEGHVLVLGATFAPEPGCCAEDIVRRARALGGIAAAAHPLERTRSGVGLCTLESVGFDAVEGFNSKTLERRANADAESWARARGLPVIAGSDAHFAATVGRAHTIVEAEELSVSSVLAGVLAGRTELVKGEHTLTELARYWAGGWLTRPWVIDLARRARAARRAARRRAAELAEPTGTRAA